MTERKKLGHMTVALLMVSAALTCVLAGCGARFGPGIPMQDKACFSEAPHIFMRGDSYSLRWRYGTDGFFFRPRAKIINGQLLFTLQATSSSGALAGRYGEIMITDPAQLKALRSGGAYWYERDKQKIRLEVKTF